MAQLFGSGRDQQITNPHITARAHRLEKVLHRYTNLTFDAADGLLEQHGKFWIGFLYTNRELKF